ncbi:hypothetical protein BGX27_000026 [Mortierella sp. AM989]|nr:hypothetical protein BGX27_000026 [Mortierella sp. AM989]
MDHPDIDEERHNGVAIYMSHLFTWHGYAMLLFGSCYVIFYGSSHYTSSGPVITNVAIAFSCMGLAPFFALMFVLLGALILLYTFYILFVCLIWPLEKCGLSRRRAISRRNGGYRSNGTTNTTDLREIERAIENAENGGSGGGGFGGMDNIKLTPAVAAIPIVIFRKPKIKQADTIPNAVCGIATSSQQETVIANREDPEFVKASVDLTAETVEEIQDIKEPKKPQKVHGKPETIEDTTEEHLEVVSGDHHINHTGSSQATSDRYVATSIPSANDSHNDAINKMPSNLSALGISTTGLPRTYTPSPRSRSSSVSLTGYTGSSWMGNTASQTLPAAPFIPCVTGQEMTEVEARLRPGTPASVTTANSQRPAYGLPKSSSSSRSVIININSDSNSSGAKNKQSSYMNQRVSITSSGGIASANATATGTGSVSESRSVKDHPTIYDEECAICLFDFEDGDELRHLYCDHFFHRSCVDRWLTKNAFCPKCKRGI